ncbi:hypothetical protein [Siphonobacter sp. SORGH_AS_1065]|uniref:hypothetical protein n=1 Tax=Siphonobacter sp. SORGH_AS_1065 TaxID=3041795 RepID=UPI00278A1140|nr:hypothetical protein [Siphonobacter sp. SORGH_AS_1065]MDQ1090452.1 hypothetical protein [Siphonobacter sp. SORGH_AS_1065]
MAKPKKIEIPLLKDIAPTKTLLSTSESQLSTNEEIANRIEKTISVRFDLPESQYERLKDILYWERLTLGQYLMGLVNHEIIEKNPAKRPPDQKQKRGPKRKK